MPYTDAQLRHAASRAAMLTLLHLEGGEMRSVELIAAAMHPGRLFPMSIEDIMQMVALFLLQGWIEYPSDTVRLTEAGRTFASELAEKALGGEN